MKRSAVVAALIVSGSLSGCSFHRPAPPASCPGLEDSSATVERLLELTGGAPGDHPFTTPCPKAFLERRFSVFDRHDKRLEVSRWAWVALDRPGILTEDLRPVTPTWFEQMDTEAAWNRPDRIDRPGIALRTTALRAMPTGRPLIEDPSIPGQGFAFDLLQNALVDAGEPLWLSHRSRSGRWVFVSTSYASGWILDRDAALLAPEVAFALSRMTPVALVEEGFPIRSQTGAFLFSGRIGMILPSAGPAGEGVPILVPSGKDEHGDAVFETVTLEPRRAVSVPVEPTLENLASVASKMLGLPYGWGGLFGNRDCSSLIRDFFMPFGLWLPRNSRDQAVSGERIDLRLLDDRKKAEAIVSRGAPFATILWKPGHVALYVGRNEDGDPVILHSAWDLRTCNIDEPVRRHIGRAVLTILRPAGTVDDEPCSTTLLSQLETMTAIGR